MVRISKTLVAAMLVVMLVAALAPIHLTAKAQDGGGLTDEQRALVDRVTALAANRDSYTSYVKESATSQVMSLNVSVMGLIIGINSSKNVTSTTTKISGDPNDNIVTVSTVEYTEQSAIPGQESDIAYTLQSEVRSVDGVVYAMGSYVDSSGEVTVLPEGWVVVTNESDWAGAFSELDWSDFFPNDTPSPFEDAEVLNTALSDISSSATTLEDGTEAEVITMTFSPEGFMEVMARMGTVDMSNPLLGPLFSQLASTDGMALTAALTLTEGDQPVGFDVSMNWILEGAEFDLGSVDPSMPAGMMAGLDLSISMTQSEFLHDINSADLVPATAPEGAATPEAPTAEETPES